MEQKQMHKWLQITNSVQKTKSGFTPGQGYNLTLCVPHALAPDKNTMIEK